MARTLGRRTRLVVPIVGALVVNIALLVFLTRLSGSVDVPDYDPEGAPVTVITPPEQQKVEPPTPPPPRPPKPKEPPKFEPTPMVASARPIPGIELSAGPGIGVAVPDMNADGLVFNEADLDHKPRLIMNPCQYPYRANRLQIEGVVTVRFTVLEDGSVTNVEIVSAKPEGLFEDNVLECVPRWRFEPGRVGGKPVVWSRLYDVLFELKR